jgi:integrase
MKLTDMLVRSTKAANKRQTLFDGGGLYLVIEPSESKLWRMKYRFNGKEKLLSFGKYPDVSLKEARERAQGARKLLANDQDPGEVKKAQKAAVRAASENTFEAVAREWHAVWRKGTSDNHADRVIARLDRDVFPWIGNAPVSEVTAPVVLNSVLRRIEGKGYAEATFRAKVAISQVMRFAIAAGKAEIDPCPSLRGILAPRKQKHMAAITEPAKVRELLWAIDQYAGSHVVRAALALAPLVFVRPGELRAARWANIDLERAEWRYTVSKTKTDHLVPLARQAVAILRDIQPLTGQGEFVFPGTISGRGISDATINRALQRMGYDTREEMTGHGFRAMARTLLAEELHFPPEVIEHQLAHKVPDALGTAYNRTKFLKERRTMMQDWADYLDRLKKGAEVIPIRSMP